MHSHNLWQAALVAASAAIVNAAPTRNDLPGRAEPVEMLRTCSDKIKAQNWQTDIPPWFTGDKKPAGNQFCLSHWDTGARIVGLAAWKEDDNGDCSGKGAINRLEVRFSDGSTIPMGSKKPNKNCDAGSIGIGDEEFIYQVTTQVAGDHPNAQGKIGIKTRKKTNNSQWPWILVQEKWLKDEYNPGALEWNQNPKAGNLIGLTGWITDAGVISSINFQFADSPVARQTRTNVQYDYDLLSKIPINAHNIAVGTATNWNGDPNHPDLAVLRQTVTHSWSATMSSENTWANKQGVAPKFGIESPELKLGKISFEVGGTFEWSHETKSTDGTSDSHEESTEFRYVAHVRPGQTVEVVGSWASATVDQVPYTADSSYVFEDGTSWKFTEHGKTSGDLQLLQNYTAAKYRNATSSDLAIANVVRVDQN